MVVPVALVVAERVVFMTALIQLAAQQVQQTLAVVVAVLVMAVQVHLVVLEAPVL
jgi:hypothetical protein